MYQLCSREFLAQPRVQALTMANKKIKDSKVALENAQELWGAQLGSDFKVFSGDPISRWPWRVTSRHQQIINKVRSEFATSFFSALRCFIMIIHNYIYI